MSQGRAYQLLRAARVVECTTVHSLQVTSMVPGIVGADLESSWQGQLALPRKAINPPLNQLTIGKSPCVYTPHDFGGPP
jgi:hypothetical protein